MLTCHFLSPLSATVLSSNWLLPWYLVEKDNKFVFRWFLSRGYKELLWFDATDVKRIVYCVFFVLDLPSAHVNHFYRAPILYICELCYHLVVSNHREFLSTLYYWYLCVCIFGMVDCILLWTYSVQTRVMWLYLQAVVCLMWQWCSVMGVNLKIPLLKSAFLACDSSHYAIS